MTNDITLAEKYFGACGSNGKDRTVLNYICDCPEGYIIQEGQSCDLCKMGPRKRSLHSNHKTYFWAGEFRTVRKIAEMEGLKVHTIYNRLRKGWALHTALYTEVKTYKLRNKVKKT